MAREWQEIKHYKPEQIGTDHLISQSAQGYFEKNTLVEGILTQVYDLGNGPVQYTSEGRFVDGKLVEGKKMRGKTLIQESKFDLSRRNIVTSFGPDGRPSKRVYISKTGDWLKTELYEKGRLVLLREPNAALNITIFREYSPESGRPAAVGYMLWDREIPYPNIYKLKEIPAGTQSVTLRDTHRKLVYQGDVNGFIPHGKGKIYNRYSETIYVGEIQHGLRHGRGTSYGPEDGKTTLREYVGEFSEDRFHGKGTMYDATGEQVKYEGEWENGFLIQGTEYDGDTVVYRGSFHGRAADGHYFHHGKGELFHKNGAPRFKGNFAYDMFTGDNVEVFNFDATKYYEGDLVDGLFGHYGVVYLPDGTILEQRSDFDALDNTATTEITHYGAEGIILYKGGADLITDGAQDGMEHITDYKRQREGVVNYENGERFEGTFKDNHRHGPGTYYYADGTVKFQGNFYMGEYNGECRENRPDGSMLFQGFFERGRCVRGEGTFQFDEEEYTGRIENGLRVGRGEVRYPDGKIRYRGGFENNLYAFDGEEYYETGSLRYSGSYKEGLYDGYGLLYSEYGDLIYDGDWEAGFRTGQGKMYYKDGSYYEGGFLKNQKEGHGCDYYPEGQLRYEGEFRADREQGQGTLYSQNDIKIYEGQWQNGQYHGEGHLYYPDGSLHFSGQFREGKLHGEGSEYDEKGRLRFEGRWENGERSGKGRVYYKNKESFFGTISNGLKQGFGQYYYADGKLAYEGEYLDNKRHGQGTAYDQEGRLHYRGEWKNGLKDGQGCQYSPTGGLVYEGSYQEGKFHGQGKYYTEDQTLYYEGSFQYGKRNGYGLHYNREGICDYAGYYEDGLRSGFGISYSPDGAHVMYSGFWSLGKYHGCGVIYLHDQPRFSGMFLNGEMNGRINEIDNGRIVREAIYENGQTVYQRSYDQADVLIYEGGACLNGLPDGDGISYDGLGNVTFKGRFHQGRPIELGSFLRKTVEPIPEIPELGNHDFNLYRTKTTYKIMGVELEKGVRLFCTLENGVPVGVGSAVFYDGRKYFGPFQDGRPTGQGTVSGPDGRKFTGEIFDGIPHGYGILSLPDGNRYEGEFRSFLRNGNLRVLCANGDIVHAQFRDDVQVSHAVQYKFVEQSLSRFPDSIPAQVSEPVHVPVNPPIVREDTPPASPTVATPTPATTPPPAAQAPVTSPPVSPSAPLPTSGIYVPAAKQESVEPPVGFHNDFGGTEQERVPQAQSFRNATDNLQDSSIEILPPAKDDSKKAGFTVNIENVSGNKPLPAARETVVSDEKDAMLREAQDVLSSWMES